MNSAVGARVTVQPDKTRKEFEGFFEYDHFFPDDDFGIDIGYSEFVFGVTYGLTALLRQPAMYIGIEVTAGNIKATTDALGATLTGKGDSWYGGFLAGLRVRLGRAKPFIEGRFNMGKASQAVLSTGVCFQFGS